MFFTDWTDERVALLKELWPIGSAAWIANEINARTGARFTRNSIISKAHRAKLEKPKDLPSEWQGIGKYSRQAAEGRKNSPPRPRKPRLGYKRHNGTLPPTLIEQTIPPDFLGLTIWEIRDGLCRFPKGDKAPYLFCGQPALEGSSYCAYCHRVTHNYEPVAPRPKQRGSFALIFCGAT